MAPPMKKKVPTGIYGELIKLFGAEQARKAGETFNAWVERVGAVISDAPEEKATQMSEAAGAWYDSAVDAVSAKPPQPIPPLSGWPEDVPSAAAAILAVKPAAPAATAPAAAPAADNTKEQANVSTPKKKPVKKTAAKTPAKPVKKATKTAAKKPVKKAAKPKAEKVASGPRVDGVAYKVRAAVVAKPDITYEAAAKAAGVKAEKGSHAFNVYQSAVSVMAIALAAGYK